jgi:hypothetical protein
MVSYQKIFKQAYEITKNNKFLWIFGLFLSLVLTASWAGEPKMDPNPIAIPNYIVAVVLILFLAFIIIYFRCRASLILAIKAVLEKEHTSLTKSFRGSRNYWMRFLVISVVVDLFTLLFGGIIGLPVYYMFQQGFTYRAISLLIVGLLIFIPLAVTFLLINVLAPMFVTLYNFKVRESVKASLDLITKHWFTLVTLGFWTFLPQLAIGLIASTIVFSTQLKYHTIELAGLILSGIILLIFSSLIVVFQQAVWVVAFIELVKPLKPEEPEQVIVPEIAT